MGGVCGIGSIKGRLSPIGSLQGALSIPVGGGLDCDIYEGEYNIVPSDTVQVLPTANKLLKHDIVIEANSGGLPEGSEMATDDDIDSLIDDVFGTGVNPDPDEPIYSPDDTVKTFSKDYKTVTTVYANGNQLVKTFSDDMKTITSVLTDSEGTVIATETKTLSDDGLTISTDVVYG